MTDTVEAVPVALIDDLRRIIEIGRGRAAQAVNRQTLRVGFIQGLVGSGQCPPPSAEAAALLTQREVAVEHDSINTVIATIQEVFVVGAKIVNLFHGCCALARECLFTQSLGTTGQE